MIRSPNGSIPFLLGLLLLGGALAPSPAHAGEEPIAANRAGVEFFEKKIRPVLADRCYLCHSAGAKKVRGGLHPFALAHWIAYLGGKRLSEFQLLSQPVSRRQMLARCANGFGLLALDSLLAETRAAAPASASDLNPLAVRAPHHTPRAKRIIFLFMGGGPSQLDLFDPKPRLTADHGKPLPFEKPKLVRTTTENAVDKKVHVHDLHATLLHLLGIDHERLTYRYSGRDYRLTDVSGNVVKEVLA